MQFKNDIPYMKKGITLDRICFSGGRVSTDLAKHGGLTSIKYYGRQNISDVLMFEADPISAWKQLFKLFVEVNGRLYYAEFNHTKIYPYGYESSFEVEGDRFVHRLKLLNDSLVFEIEIIGKANNKNIRFALLNTQGHVKSSPENRTWNGFYIDKETDSLMARVFDDYSKTNKTNKEQYLTQNDAFGLKKIDFAESYIAVSSSNKAEFKKTPDAFEKDYVFIYPRNNYGNFIILFGHDKDEFKERLNSLKNNVADKCNKLKEHYSDLRKLNTKIFCQDKSIKSFMNNAGTIIESLMVKDIAGGMRAADSGYWIWGWDSMVFSDSAMISGRHDSVEQMLEYYRVKSHPEHGIFHNISLAGTPQMSMAFPAQTLYCIMLYNYAVFTGDFKKVKEYYSFAVKIINKAIELEVNYSGLIRGVSLYPDFPEYLDQDGNDISSFNNSVMYQALRCMEILALKLGNNADAMVYKSFAGKLKYSFNRYLFDEEKSYYFDSISADDFSPRKHYPVYAILWVTEFAYDLVLGKINSLACFMYNNLKARTGVQMLPAWDSAFMLDGNQLGMYMPITEGFFRHLMRFAGYEDDLMKVISENWSRIMIPEALTAEAVNHGLTPDNPGRKQAFCINSWYSLFFSYYLGIIFQINGIKFSKAMTRETVRIDNLNIRNKSFSIEFKDNGTIYLNNKQIDYGFIEYEKIPSNN